MIKYLLLLILQIVVANTFAFEFKPGGWKEEDIPSELITPSKQVLNKIEIGTDEEFFSNKSNLEQEIKNLNNIQDLDTKGRQQQMQESELLDALYPDSSAPGMGKHLEDIQDIAESTGKMMKNLVHGLKHHNDIDCIEYQADPAVESNYQLKREQKRNLQTIEEPFFCEYLRNQYNCEDTLELHCLKFGSKAIDIRITNANTPYEIKNGKLIADYKYSSDIQCYFSKNADGKTWDWSFCGRTGMPDTYEKRIDSGLIFKDHTYTRKFGCAEGLMEINFDVSANPVALSDTSNLQLEFSGHILVTLNNQVIFASAGGDSLNFSGSYNEVLDYSKKEGIIFVQETKGVSYYPVISTGNSTFNLGEAEEKKFRSRSNSKVLNIKNYLRNGNNSLAIKACSADTGNIKLAISINEKTCEKWSEPKWNETCILKSN